LISWPYAAKSSRASTGKTTAVIELVIAYGLIEAALWTEGAARTIWFWVAAAWIIGVNLYRYRSPREMGLGFAGIRRSLWILAAALVIAGVVLTLGRFAGSLHPLHMRAAVWSILLYVIWALEQQFILQSFFFLRLDLLVGSTWSVLVSALLFALAHLPNPVLTVATFAGALAFCELFRRYRNLWILAVAHAVLGLALAAAVPVEVHRNMRVGIGYLTFR